MEPEQKYETWVEIRGVAVNELDCVRVRTPVELLYSF